MRILVVTNMYPPHHFGGYELSCQDAVRRFRARGHQVTVLTSTVRVDGVPDGPEDAVRRDLQIYWQDHRLLDPGVTRRLAMELHNRRAFLAAVRSARPDVVSVWNMGAVSLGLLTILRRRAVPVVFVLADDWPNYAPELDAWSRRFRGPKRAAVGRWLHRITGVPTVISDFSELGACLFYSRFTMETVRRNGAWAMARRGVVYSGVEADDFPVPAAGQPVAERPWDGRLLYVGRIDDRKGIDTILRALPALPGARLRVVGRGDDGYLRRLRDLAGDLGIDQRVTFTSSPRAELRSEYGSADALVFPSVYDEPFGIVPLEGMACDTPVVATGTGGSGEYLADGWNCLLYPPGDEVELAAAVQRLAGDPALRRKLVEGGRATARVLTTEAWMESLLAWHESAAGGFRRPLPADRELGAYT